jgi:thiamine-phosphate pyrophosphorylase
MNNKIIKGIYTIIDPGETTHIFKLCSDLAKSGISVIQYRDKKNNFEDKVTISKNIKLICDKYNITFIINDSPILAKEVKADGVHIGQNDDSIEYCKTIMNTNQIIGTSNNNINEINDSISHKVNYMAIGKVFETSTMDKLDRNIVGLSLIKEAHKLSDIPIVGIGGININNASSVIDSGADSICVVSAITKSQNPIDSLKKFNEILNN